MGWVPAPGKGRATVFSVFVAEPPNVFNWESPEKSGHLLGVMKSKTRFTWVVHWEQDIDSPTRQFIEDNRARAQHMPSAQLAVLESDALRMVLWGQGETKADLFFIELNALPSGGTGKENAG